MSDTAPLNFRQRMTAAAVAAGMGLVAAYAAVISYLAVRRLADAQGLPLPWLYPVGVEGGLVAVLALDLLVTWTRQPIGWLRQFARLLAVAAIAINAVAGLIHTGPVAAVLHALPPVIFVAAVEALRTVLLRRIAEENPDRRDPIPRARWLLAPLTTFALWRRMVLWQITDYSHALDTDLARREAVYGLRRTFGRRWRRQVPADVAYRLDVGVRLSETLLGM